MVRWLGLLGQTSALGPDSSPVPVSWPLDIRPRPNPLSLLCLRPVARSTGLPSPVSGSRKWAGLACRGRGPDGHVKSG